MLDLEVAIGDLKVDVLCLSEDWLNENYIGFVSLNDFCNVSVNVK